MDKPVEFQSKLKGKKLTSQTREVITNVTRFMELEARESRFTIDPKKVRDRVSAACGVSKRTLTRISTEKRKLEEMNSNFGTTNKKRKVTKRITGLDDFDVGVVRRIVNNFYLSEKCLPTLNMIKIRLENDLGFVGSKTSVRRILKNIGFRWKKTKTNKHILMESQDVVHKRFVYLKKLREFRAENRPIVYTDESYIDSAHVSGKGWFDDSLSGVAAQISKGERLIILHAGGEMGFIPNCLTMWKASKKTGDYHDNVNSDIYVRWLNEKLLPNLPPRSVVVIDNASYHNKQIDKCPTSNSTKADMQQWLNDRNIQFTVDMLKVQLYDLIKLHKPASIRYLIDDIIKAQGFDVLRLPPYHPELNTIELIWADVKNWVASHNVTFKFNDVERLTKFKFESMNVADWEKKCESVKRLEEYFFGNQAQLENTVESYVIKLGVESSDDEDFGSEDGSDDDDCSQNN
ncbi:hypothetical protein LSTR_LSTR001901 [Laodelphax striatellus]|uniref:Tc1-like transposase DDE domain-containing protein n=1 Tax=Laodelphax striatellus TaxID=195883 RepID=A0A482WG25_LAOST|nr:hypothetical protein LSTR_LSTR001901 [Laodelphax striatellus]